MQGEVTALSSGLHKERGAAQAAQEKARAAVEQLHRTELRYLRQLESLEAQLKAERVRARTCRAPMQERHFTNNACACAQTGLCACMRTRVLTFVRVLHV